MEHTMDINRRAEFSWVFCRRGVEFINNQQGWEEKSVCQFGDKNNNLKFDCFFSLTFAVTNKKDVILRG